MAYAAQVQWMDSKEVSAFDRELPRAPHRAPSGGGGRHGFSSGTHELMAMMTGQPNVTASRA